MNQVIVLSGASGSGKSTFAKQLNGRIVSADSYFMKNGAYQFNPAELSNAHAHCFRMFIEHLQNKKEKVIVDNTNTTVEEISPYMLGAAAYQYSASIITVQSTLNPQELSARNLHGVGEKIILAQLERIKNRKLPHYWKREYYFNDRS